MKKKTIIFMLVLSALVCLAAAAVADEYWYVNSSDRVKFFQTRPFSPTGKYTINGIEYMFSPDHYVMGNGEIQTFVEVNYTITGTKYYYIDENDKVVTGWINLNGNRYYARPDGIDEYRGKLITGHYTIDGDTYSFNKEGIMQTGLLGRYYFGSDGKRQYGWQTIDGKRYYFDLTSGECYRGRKTIDEKNYYFDEDGVMQTGLVTVVTTNGLDKNIYGYGEDGEQLIGWQDFDGKTYWFNESGNHAAVTGQKKIDGDYYYFDTKEAFLKKNCFVVLDTTPKTIYYFESDGKYASGWKTIDGNTYYFKPIDHKAVTNVYMIDKNSYYFDEDGHMVTGLINMNGQLYYYDPDGKEARGWRVIDGNTYYFNSYAVKASLYIDGDYYYFDDSGVMQRGLVDIRSETYAYGEDGKRLSGWQVIDGKTYYFTPAAIKGETEYIDGKEYLFEEDGQLHVHTEEIIPGYASTSMYPGLSDGIKCSVCGEVLLAQEETPPTYRWEQGQTTRMLSDGYYMNIPSSFYWSDGAYRHDSPLVAMGFDIQNQVIPLYQINLVFYDEYYADSSYVDINGIHMLLLEYYDGANIKMYTFNTDLHTCSIIFSMMKENESIDALIDAVLHNIHNTALQGWVTEKSGKRCYYVNGEKCIGKHIIDNTPYCFGDDGVLVINDWYASSDGEAYYTDQNGIILLAWKPGENGWLCLPEGTMIVKREAFKGTKAQILVVPASCRRIESGAFANCSNLQYVIVLSDTIGIADDAFENTNCRVIEGPPKMTKYYGFAYHNDWW